MTRRRWISASALAGFSVICSLAVTQSATAGMKTYYSESRGKVRIVWSGRIQRPMAKQLSRAISKWHDRALNGVELVLNSGGGSMLASEKILREIELEFGTFRANVQGIESAGLERRERDRVRRFLAPGGQDHANDQDGRSPDGGRATIHSTPLHRHRG